MGATWVFNMTLSSSDSPEECTSWIWPWSAAVPSLCSIWGSLVWIRSVSPLASESYMVWGSLIGLKVIWSR